MPKFVKLPPMMQSRDANDPLGYWNKDWNRVILEKTKITWIN